MKPDAKKRQKLDATRMLAGPDGNSLKCGFCGWWGYVTPDDALFIACPKCAHPHHWAPVPTCCASSTHGVPLGCGSPVCWNRRSDLL